MADNSFQPDFSAWYNKKSVKKEDFCWVLLGINPSDIKKRNKLKEYFEIASDYTFKSHDSNSEAQEEYYWKFDFYIKNLPIEDSLHIKSHYEQLMQLAWSGDKHAFICEAYRHRVTLHPYVYKFLGTIGKKPFDANLEAFKNHEHYKASLQDKNLNEITDEDTALCLLLGLEPNQVGKFLALDAKHASGKPGKECLAIYWDFPPEDKWLLIECRKFLRTEFGWDWPGIIINKLFHDIKELRLWSGDFSAYVRQLYSNGVVFRPETEEALKTLGISLSYTPDCWAVQFYRRFLRLGILSLNDAAHLYLGSNPRKEREFIDLGNVRIRGQGAGLAIETPDTICEYDENGEYINLSDVTLTKVVRRLTDKGHDHVPEHYLEDYVRNHVAAGNIIAVKDDGRGEIYFKPQDIFAFFRSHFRKTLVPEALFLAMQGSNKSLDTQEFDQDPYWTIAETKFWIATRDLEEVNKVLPKHRHDSKLATMAVAMQNIEKRIPNDNARPIDEVLIEKARNGEISVMVRVTENDSYRQVNSADLTDAHISQTGNKTICEIWNNAFNPLIGIAPLFKRADVVKAWPEPQKASAESTMQGEARASNSPVEEGAIISQLAEWIYQQRIGQGPKAKESLYESASLNSFKIYGVTQPRFNAAYKKVYATKQGRPPKQGWPLQPEYAQRYENERLATKVS